MDFLVAGLGFGALLVLAGYAVREFGVFLFVPTRIRKQFAEDVDLAGAWRRLCRVGSNVAMLAGVVTWGVLVAAVLLSASDRTGAYLLAGTATLLSGAGAAAIYLAYRRMHVPAISSAHADVSAVSAGWNETEVVADDDTAPLDGWKPRIIPKPTATIIDQMPAWDAVYEHLQAAEVETSVTVKPRADAPEPAIAQPGDPIEPEAVEVAEPVATTVAPIPESDVESERVEAAAIELELEPASLEAEPSLVPVAIQELVEPAAAVPATEPAPVDQIIFAESALDPPPLDAETAAVPRRFKSALLSDIDDPSTVDANARFKSSILADLSAVRLPDDGPRFRSTALVDLAKPETDETDPPPANGAPNRRG